MHCVDKDLAMCAGYWGWWYKSCFNWQYVAWGQNNELQLQNIPWNRIIMRFINFPLHTCAQLIFVIYRQRTKKAFIVIINLQLWASLLHPLHNVKMNECSGPETVVLIIICWQLLSVVWCNCGVSVMSLTIVLWPPTHQTNTGGAELVTNKKYFDWETWTGVICSGQFYQMSN